MGRKRPLPSCPEADLDQTTAKQTLRRSAEGGFRTFTGGVDESLGDLSLASRRPPSIRSPQRPRAGSAVHVRYLHFLRPLDGGPGEAARRGPAWPALPRLTRRR